MHVVTLTHPLPTADHPGTMAPVARQIESLRAIGVTMTVVEVAGPAKLKYLLTLPRFHTLLERADLVHAHYGYCGWLGRTQWRRPLVVSFMGDDLLGSWNTRGRITALSRLVVAVDRGLAHTVDAVIVKSQQMARVVAPVAAHVVPNGVDVQVFRPLPVEEARAQLGWPTDASYVLFPGSPYDPRKGFALAVQAIGELGRRFGQHVELVPLWNVAPEVVPLYMNACDVMLMTSLSEGSPNVVKEALACNLPVVGVPVGDVHEMLAGVEGCVSCPRDAAALASALAGILTSRRRSKGRAALFARRLDLRSVAHRLTGIYEDVLANKRRRHTSHRPAS